MLRYNTSLSNQPLNTHTCTGCISWYRECVWRTIILLCFLHRTCICTNSSSTASWWGRRQRAARQNWSNTWRWDAARPCTSSSCYSWDCGSLLHLHFYIAKINVCRSGLSQKLYHLNHWFLTFTRGHQSFIWSHEAFLVWRDVKQFFKKIWKYGLCVSVQLISVKKSELCCYYYY